MPERRMPAVVRLLLDVGASVAAYYLLRAVGVGASIALAAGAVFPAGSLVWEWRTNRRVDPFGGVVLATMLAGIVVAAVGGSPRTLLVRNAFLTAPAAAWTLLSLRAAQPFCFEVTRLLLPHRAAVMDRLWAEDARFRLAWRRITACWGVVLVVDAGLRVAMSYRLPVDAVPALDTALSVGTAVALQVPTHLLLWRSGSWPALFARRRVSSVDTG